MKQDIILAGVGGQGILSIAFVIDSAALKASFQVKQAEVHGMSQRGGAVQSHLRLSDKRIFSDLIPKGEADLILSVEPLETLRYLDYLKPEGIVVSSRTPLINIPDYPDLETVLHKIKDVSRQVIVDSEKLAREAGSARTQNMVVLGAASHFLMVKKDDLVEFIGALSIEKAPAPSPPTSKLLNLAAAPPGLTLRREVDRHGFHRDQEQIAREGSMKKRPGINLSRVNSIFRKAEQDNRQFLLEPEVYALLRACGIAAPRFLFLEKGEKVGRQDLSALKTPEVVVKVVSPLIVHKSDVGGVAFVPSRPAKVNRVIRSMLQEVPARFYDDVMQGLS